MTIERYRTRIHAALEASTPALLRSYTSKLADPLLEFALDLLLETLETDAPHLLAGIDAEPHKFPAMVEKLKAARQNRLRPASK